MKEVPVNFREAVVRNSGNYVQDSNKTRQFLFIANRALQEAGVEVQLVEVFEVDHES